MDKCVPVYHGNDGKFPEKIKDYNRFGGFHVGTKKAAEDRGKAGQLFPRRENEWVIHELSICPKKEYKPNGKILDERLADDRTELFVISGLKSKRDELRAQGYDAIPYINSEEDPGSVSYMVLDPNIIKKPLSSVK